MRSVLFCKLDRWSMRRFSNGKSKIFKILLTSDQTVCLVSSSAYVTLIDQSERSYSVRHAVFVTLFNQSEHGYSVRHAVFVTLFNQSEHICAASRSLKNPARSVPIISTSLHPAPPCAASKIRLDRPL